MKTTFIADSVKANERGSRMHVHIELRGPNRELKDVRDIYNTVTSAAKIRIADWIQTTPATSERPSHMAVGTGTPSATALGTETDRNALTSSTTSGTAVLTMVGDWAAGDATAALTEAGVFDNVTGATMWLSTSFSVINKAASDTLAITWTLTIG